MVAVLPQSVEEARAYLARLRVSVDSVVQASLDSLPVAGTPVLLLVDAKGTVRNVWVGRLAPEKEAEVLAHLD